MSSMTEKLKEINELMEFFEGPEIAKDLITSIVINILLKIEFENFEFKDFDSLLDAEIELLRSRKDNWTKITAETSKRLFESVMKMEGTNEDKIRSLINKMEKLEMKKGKHHPFTREDLIIAVNGGQDERYGKGI